VTIEDLGSRNGVLVNGHRITDKISLAPRDKITVGLQEFVLQVEADGAARKTADARLPTAPPPQFRMSGPVPVGERQSSLFPPPEGEEPSTLRRADALKLLGGAADKAIAMGRVDEAERLLSGVLAEVAEARRAGKRLSVALVDRAGLFAAKLAASTGRGAWVDLALELYQSQGRPCPAAVIDELYIAVHKVKSIDLARLREYVASLRAKQATFGPADRFLVQRIEGLETLASLR
jgi:hypothetical protein